MRSKNLILTMSAVTSAVLLLISCSGGGGGGSNATTASTGSSTVSGTVTGFGSVIVDGVRVDDRGTVAGMEGDDNSVANVELKIGQSVEILHDGNLKASQIRVNPEMKGVISAIDTAAGTMTVLGMTVIINTNPSLGPITLFEAPYTFASAAQGDGVEIHGILTVDAAGKQVFQATRVEKESIGNTYKLRGRASLLSAGATTFKLGDLTINYQNARINPSAASLTDGADVTVFIPSSTTFNGAAVSATAVKVKNHSEENGDKEAQLRGVISNLIVGAKTFTLNGLNIDASQAIFDHAGKSFTDLSNGAYVRVKGAFQTDGSLKAKSVAIRKVEIETDGEIELHGSVLDYVSAASFSVRGTKIDASGITLECPSGTALQNGLQVEVEGQLISNGSVRAKEIKCEEQDEGSSTIEREGLAGTVNTTAKTFVLSGSSTANVQWTATTLFVSPLTAEMLNNNKVEVEGTVSAGVLTASKIKLDD